MMEKILLVDDEMMNRVVASKILNKEGYEVVEAEDGAQALEVLHKQNDFALVLMDLMMPVMDGFAAIEAMKKEEALSAIPIIVISALSDKESIYKALEMGANDYLGKPFDLVEFRLRIHNTVKLRDALMYEEAKRSEADALSLLAKAGEFKDNETSMHTVRVGEISAFFAQKLGFDEKQCDLIRLAAPMHDIGKIGIPDSILLKPGRLDGEEFAKMKEHARIGYEILSMKKTPLLQLAATIAKEHHEKFDGSGYPEGLEGEAISKEARIVALTDVFDALLSKRPYKEPFSVEKTVSIINEGSGSHFDPGLVAIFNENLSDLLSLRERFTDA